MEVLENVNRILLNIDEIGKYFDSDKKQCDLECKQLEKSRQDLQNEFNMKNEKQANLTKIKEKYNKLDEEDE